MSFELISPLRWEENLNETSLAVDFCTRLDSQTDDFAVHWNRRRNWYFLSFLKFQRTESISTSPENEKSALLTAVVSAENTCWIGARRNVTMHVTGERRVSAWIAKSTARDSPRSDLRPSCQVTCEEVAPFMGHQELKLNSTLANRRQLYRRPEHYSCFSTLRLRLTTVSDVRHCQVIRRKSC